MSSDGTWNRIPGRTAADVNLDAAPFGFKVTGDAAWDPDSDDFAMFTAEGDRAVAAMVKTARVLARCKPEAEAEAWIKAEKKRIAACDCPSPRCISDDGHPGGHGEVYDTMVRETVAYALDEAWREAYGHRFGEARP